LKTLHQVIAIIVNKVIFCKKIK